MYRQLTEQAERYLKSLYQQDDIAGQLKRKLADLMARGEANADAACVTITELADSLLRRTPRPTAVFAWNDLCAIGLIHALRERDLEIPRDMSVAGHDDLEIAARLEPPLTTVHWPMYQMGQHSIRYLYKLREGRNAQRPAVPAPELQVRGSTAPVPK